MKIYDVTHYIREGMAVYPGNDVPPTITKVDTSANSDFDGNLGAISFGLHTGTHVDTPFHFLHVGKNLDGIDLSRFIGDCRVIAIPVDRTVVSRADLEPFAPQAGEIILLKTANSLKPEDAPFAYGVALTVDAAEYLVECEVKTIGVDWLSVEGQDTRGVVHRTILGAELGIIEGLYMPDVPAGNYFISALPLRIEGMEGSPVRAVLIEKE